MSFQDAFRLAATQGSTVFQYGMYNPVRDTETEGQKKVDLSNISHIERLPEYLMWGAVGLIVTQLAVDFFTKSAVRTVSNLYLFVVSWYATTLIQQIPLMESFAKSALQFQDHNTTLGTRVEHFKEQTEHLARLIEQLQKMPTEFGKTREELAREIHSLQSERGQLSEMVAAGKRTLEFIETAIGTHSRRLSESATRFERLEQTMSPVKPVGSGRGIVSDSSEFQ